MGYILANGEELGPAVVYLPIVSWLMPLTRCPWQMGRDIYIGEQEELTKVDDAFN